MKNGGNKWIKTTETITTITLKGNTVCADCGGFPPTPERNCFIEKFYSILLNIQETI